MSGSISNFLLGKQYIGIEHFSVGNNDMSAWLLVEKKKGELTIAAKEITSKLATPENWNKKLPLFVIVNTSQVIQKEIPAIDASDEKLLHKAFPNLAWNEFYYEVWRLKTKSVIAVSRKSYVDKLVTSLNNQGTVAGVSLGICTISEIAQYTDEKEFLSNHQKISLNEDDTIIGPNTSGHSFYTINGIEIGNAHLLAFGGVVRLVVGSILTSGNLYDFNSQLKDNYLQKSFFTNSNKIIIGTLLTTLLVNFFLFNHYFKKAQEMSEIVLLNKSSLTSMVDLKQRISLKEEKVKGLFGSGASKTTHILNTIAQKTPNSILLSEMSYNPLVKKIKPGESIDIENNVISISGTTIDNEAFTHWIDDINKLDWIANVVITRFGKSEVQETQFSLKLTLKP